MLFLQKQFKRFIIIGSYEELPLKRDERKEEEVFLWCLIEFLRVSFKVSWSKDEEFRKLLV